jgi:chromosome segregation ATPase
MKKDEIKKLVLENASLKRALHQNEKKIVSIKEKVNTLKKEKKAITCRLERSRNREKELKSALAEEQKKTPESS